MRLKAIVLGIILAFVASAAIAQNPNCSGQPQALQWCGNPTGSAGLASWSTITPTALTGLGTGVATALGVNVGTAGAFVVNGGVLGIPSSGTLTNATGLPISTGLTGAGTGVLTALAVNVGTAGSVIVNGGALGSPSSAGIIPGFTLGGTISGSGNQINNVIIGYTPPGTGAVAGTISAELDRTIWVNDYGSVCDGVTDDHLAFQAAINQGQASGRPVRFLGNCAISTGLLISSSLDFGSFNGGIYGGQPNIIITNSSISAITIATPNGNPVNLHDIGIAASAPMTVGTPAIVVTGTTSNENSGSHFERLVLNINLSVGIQFVKASVWTLSHSVIATANNSIVVANTNLADSGDSLIDGNFIQCGGGGGVGGIIWNSSGGLKIANNKILGSNCTYGINISLASGAFTADLFITGNSIEGISTVSGAGIQLARQGATGGLGVVVVANNELSGQFCLFSPTDAVGVWLTSLNVTGNNCVTPSSAGFSIDSVAGIVVSNNIISPGSAGVVPVAIGTHGPTATNCVIGPNPHTNTTAASNAGSCTAIAPN
jgi:hypothetical protein